MTSQPAVFLDRDGVINRTEVRDGVPRAPVRLEDFALLPGVAEAVHRLRQAGFAVVIVTNQPDVARGDQRRSVVEAMNELLREALEPDRIMVCYHDDTDGCRLSQACARHALGSGRGPGAGPRRELHGGRSLARHRRRSSAGCRTIFVDRGYEERQPDAPDAVVADLPEAVTWIITNVAQNQEAHIA